MDDKQLEHIARSGTQTRKVRFIWIAAVALSLMLFRKRADLQVCHRLTIFCLLPANNTKPCNASTFTQVSRRDLPFVMASKQDGATTVSATMLLAAEAGACAKQLPICAFLYATRMSALIILHISSSILFYVWLALTACRHQGLCDRGHRRRAQVCVRVRVHVCFCEGQGQGTLKSTATVTCLSSDRLHKVCALTLCVSFT